MNGPAVPPPGTAPGAGERGVSEDRLAESRRELGRLLASFRKAAGLSQRRLGPLTGYSAAVVAKAEKGRRSAGAGFWSGADAVLHADGDLVRGYEKVRELQQAARQERRPEQAARSALRPGEAGDGTGPVSGAAVSGLVNCPHCRRPLALAAGLRAAPPVREL